MTYSAGIIPYRYNDEGEMEFFVGSPGGKQEGKYYALLKGHVEEDEDVIEAALREFKEESGISLPVEKHLIPLGSVLQNPKKTVVAYGIYYPNIKPDECFSNMADGCPWPEIARYKWMTYNELKKCTHVSHLPFYIKLFVMANKNDHGIAYNNE